MQRFVMAVVCVTAAAGWAQAAKTFGVGKKPAAAENAVATGLPERKLAGVDVRMGRYRKPEEMHSNAVMMENDANGRGGGDESLEWDTPGCHVRVLSRYPKNGVRSTYSVEVTKPGMVASVSEPAEGSCATAKGVKIGDPLEKAVKTYGTKSTSEKKDLDGTTVTHFEWRDGTTLEVTTDVDEVIVGLDLTGQVE